MITGPTLLEFDSVEYHVWVIPLDQLSISINADDIFNTNRFVFNSYNTPLLLSNKMDTRRFGFSINYKIPTKNKLARETPILLNKDKKEDSGIIGN